MRNILVVDDDEPICQDLRRLLEEKIRKCFLRLDDIFGIELYRVVSYHVSLKTGLDLARGCLESPRNTLEILRSIFGAYSVNNCLFSYLFEGHSDATITKEDLLISMGRDDKKGVRELFERLYERSDGSERITDLDKRSLQYSS